MNDLRKILIVEDERKIADTLGFGLSENGYDVKVAYDAYMGLDLFFNEPFNLIVLDINLPDINGFEVCKIIRAGNNLVPVIMFTSMGAMADKIEGYTAGADDYLVKPFEFTELLLKINALLRRNLQTETNLQHILQIADLQMNLNTKEVMRANNRITLTKKEFKLLEYFLNNRNRVVSRAEIALHVWGIDFDTNTNIIDVYINYLRNKIDKHFPPPLIHTQTGMGFILTIKDN